MNQTIPASSLNATHLGLAVSMPLKNGASVTDTLTDMFHAQRTKGPGLAEEWEPMTLVRFKNTRPAQDWRLNTPKDLKWLEEFFEIDGDVEVVVRRPSDAGGDRG